MKLIYAAFRAALREWVKHPLMIMCDIALVALIIYLIIR